MILLAAGLGTRLMPLTKETPKCLVQIGEKPLLQYWLEDFESSESVEEIFINTHYLPEKVEYFIANWTTKKIINLFHEKELLGTGGTLLALKSRLTCTDLIIAHADNYTSLKIENAIWHHKKRAKKTNITMPTFVTSNPSNCGIVETNKLNIVTSFEEKPAVAKSDKANSAFYVFDKVAVDEIMETPKVKPDISIDIIPNFINRIFTFPIKGQHIDIGTMSNYELAQRISSNGEL